jgi:hypothetical protein
MIWDQIVGATPYQGLSGGEEKKYGFEVVRLRIVTTGTLLIQNSCQFFDLGSGGGHIQIGAYDI